MLGTQHRGGERGLVRYGLGACGQGAGLRCAREVKGGRTALGQGNQGREHGVSCAVWTNVHRGKKEREGERGLPGGSGNLGRWVGANVVRCSIEVGAAGLHTAKGRVGERMLGTQHRRGERGRGSIAWGRAAKGRA